MDPSGIEDGMKANQCSVLRNRVLSPLDGLSPCLWALVTSFKIVSELEEPWTLDWKSLAWEKPCLEPWTGEALPWTGRALPWTGRAWPWTGRAWLGPWIGRGWLGPWTGRGWLGPWIGEPCLRPWTGGALNRFVLVPSIGNKQSVTA